MFVSIFETSKLSILIFPKSILKGIQYGGVVQVVLLPLVVADCAATILVRIPREGLAEYVKVLVGVPLLAGTGSMKFKISEAYKLDELEIRFWQSFHFKIEIVFGTFNLSFSKPFIFQTFLN